MARWSCFRFFPIHGAFMLADSLASGVVEMIMSAARLVYAKPVVLLQAVR